uniref:Protein N-terminal glutamine amidohydrolase n=1 Tax=Ascaris lumbricoides TaxID=6252 RepID=A0A0M3HN95_ASCLU
MNAVSNIDPSMPALNECDYTAYYWCPVWNILICIIQHATWHEENVWKLCERFKSSGLLTDKCYVVFISNTDRTVPLWCQRSAVTTPCVVWDYHVIFLQENGTTVLVYDLDSTIKFPCEIRRCFRVVKAFEFLKYFSSDRRHMRNDQGAFHAPPPHWSPIFDESRGHNLDDFISMDRRVLADISSVYDEDTFQRKFVTNGT